jgi:ferredoxin-type protein NapG
MDVSRRQFFRLGPKKSIQLSLTAPKEHKETYAVIRPPGALADPKAFLSACTSCGKCVEACPFDVIETLGPETGVNENTPFLNLSKKACHWCEDMPCINSCEDGALVFKENTRVAPITRVVVEEAACMNAQGTLCDQCQSVCPSSIGAIKLINRVPTLDPETCVGCGLCVWHCPADPIALHLKPVKIE